MPVTAEVFVIKKLNASLPGAIEKSSWSAVGAAPISGLSASCGSQAVIISNNASTPASLVICLYIFIIL